MEAGGPVRLVLRLVRAPRWLLGSFLAVLALGLHALALRHGSLIVVQSLLAAGLVIALYGLLASLGRAGKRAPANPWGAATLEWQAASPPLHHNFETPPASVSPYDFTTLTELPGDAGWVVTGKEVAS